MNTKFTYKDYSFIDNNVFKSIHGKNFNIYYNKQTGYTERWGITRDTADDPVLSELGPTIMDMELAKDIHPEDEWRYVNETKVENRTCLGKCKFCYKSNAFTKYSHYISLVKFKKLLMQLANTHIKINDKLIFFNDDIVYDGKKMKAIDYPELNWETDICNCSPLLQLAFGITNLTTNPELLKICAFAQKIGITPNITCHGRDVVSDAFMKALCDMCGSIAVSKYDKDLTYNFIERLAYNGARQINMHLLVSEETYDDIIETFKDVKTDKRLQYLDCIILLFLKQRGRGEGYHRISEEKADAMFDFALDNNISIGFDICSSHRFCSFVNKYQNKMKNFPNLYDFCDSACFAGYTNTLGEYCPCSFVERNGIWAESPNVLECHNFIDDIWNGEKNNLYRSVLIGKDKYCIYYDV